MKLENNNSERDSVTIILAGISGLTIASLLAKNGFAVQIFEKLPDPRKTSLRDIRSINLTVTARGLATLEKIGIKSGLISHSQYLQTRVVHKNNGKTFIQTYGKSNKGLWALRRNDLIHVLTNKVEGYPEVKVYFNAKCISVNRDSAEVVIDIDGSLSIHKSDFIIGADGVSSTVREALLSKFPIDFKRTYFDWGYYELQISAADGKALDLDVHGLHVWPSMKTLMVAIPNQGGTFSVVYLLPIGEICQKDRKNFSLQLLRQEHKDTVHLAHSLEKSLTEAPFNWLVNVSVSKWFYNDKLILLGDSCHAVFPFYGQGMNSSLEDAMLLASCLSQNSGDRAKAFLSYEDRRKDDISALSSLSEKHFFELKNHSSSFEYSLHQRFDCWLSSICPRGWHQPYKIIACPGKGYYEAMQIIKSQEKIKKFIGVNFFIYMLSFFKSTKLRHIKK